MSLMIEEKVFNIEHLKIGEAIRILFTEYDGKEKVIDFIVKEINPTKLYLENFEYGEKIIDHIDVNNGKYRIYKLRKDKKTCDNITERSERTSCEYCKIKGSKEYSYKTPKYSLDVQINNRVMNVYSDIYGQTIIGPQKFTFDINFCPNCGKKLDCPKGVSRQEEKEVSCKNCDCTNPNCYKLGLDWA